MKTLGWVLWGLGLAALFFGANNAEVASQLYVDITHKTVVNGFDSIGTDELYFALDLLRDQLISVERIMYYTNASLMGVGTILILAGRKGKPSPPTL